MATDKQRAFVDEYLIDLNGTQAAIRAGYAKATANREASRLLSNADIRQEIDKRLSERAMTANEVLERLADHARGTIEDFITEDGKLDLAAARKARRLNLIKKLEIDEKESVSGIVTRKIRIELHDPQTALTQLGRYHKLFTDRVEATLTPELIKNMSDDELRKIARGE